MKKAPVIVLFCTAMFASSIHAATTDPGALFHDYCSVCHGDKGDGKSHTQKGMVPPPRDFTSPQSAVELNQQRIVHAIKEGVPGTAMTGWKSRLSDEQIESLASLIRSKFMMPATVETATEGSRIYADFCSVCHGDTGKGALWATTGLSPRPVDFTSEQSQALLSRERMIRSVSYGRPETAMTGWKNRLTDDQMTVVVDYVINSFMEGSSAAPTSEITFSKSEVATPDSTHADMKLPLPNGLLGDLTRGTALYMANCSTCHGVEGDGRGPRAYFINPKPRDFLHTSSRASFNRPTLFNAISKGKLRTEMPAWDKVFNAQQIADVSEYVFTTFIIH